jgi:hypothetical protein
MTAFHIIAIPHDDILQGRLTMDVFAADLWEVFKGHGVEAFRNLDLLFLRNAPAGRSRAFRYNRIGRC